MKRAGFTLIEMLMAILIMGVLAVVSIDYFQENIDETRFLATQKELELIKNAIIGDESVLSAGKRADFGFVGDLGGMPTTISNLTSIGTYPAWSSSATYHLGLGWRGPYLKDPTGEEDFTKDAWGNAYVASFGTNPVTVTSYGADGAAGGVGFNTDLYISIPQERYLGKVEGFISEIGNAFTNTADIELYAPNGLGALSTSSTSIIGTANGYFTFSNIPYGERSVTAYIPSKAAATSVIGPVPIVVDKAFSLIPSSALVSAPTGTGCTVTADVTYDAGTGIDSKLGGATSNPVSQHKAIRLRFDLASDFTSISRVTVTTNNGNKVNGVNFEARGADLCAVGGGCSTTSPTQDPIDIAGYNPAAPLTNKWVEIEFKTALHGGINLSVKMEYSSPTVPSGCSTITYAINAVQSLDHSTALDYP